VLLPFMPVVFLWEYKIGYRLIYHHWPEQISRLHLHFMDWRNWKRFLQAVVPTLLGSFFFGLPSGVIAFFATRFIMIRHRQKSAAAVASTGERLAKD
jgi:hypothetical protein